MPRYFFHIRGGPEPAEDLIGSELPDSEAARAHAEKLARARLGEEIADGEPPNDARVEVEDEEGRTVFMLPHLSEAHSGR